MRFASFSVSLLQLAYRQQQGLRKSFQSELEQLMTPFLPGLVLGMVAASSRKQLCRGVAALIVSAEDVAASVYTETRRSVVRLSEDVEDAWAEARSSKTTHNNHIVS